MTFNLRFPFIPNIPFASYPEELKYPCDELMVSLNWRPPYAVLEIGPFGSQSEAKAYLPRVWGSLAWVAIARGSGFCANMSWSDMHFPEDPDLAAQNVAKSFGIPNQGKPLHALGADGFPCVVPSEKNYRFVSLMGGEVNHTDNAEEFGRTLVQGLKRDAIQSFYTDERLRTSIQLYSDSSKDSSPRAKFLTLVMALEVLTESCPKHAAAQGLLDQFDFDVSSEMERHSRDSDEWESLESLRREISFRRESSLRSRIKSLVCSSLSGLQPDELNRRARDAVWVYDQRSALVHDGNLPAETLARGYDLAKSTLLDVLRERSAWSGPGSEG